MYAKQKGEKPRLDRRNAIKNIDYDASNSSSFDDQSTHRTRKLDVLPPLSDRTSFRVEGIEGEFDRICRSLGLSGPEDFAIPAAAWEARKARSPTDHFSSPRFRRHCNLEKFETKGAATDVLSDDFQAHVRVSDEFKREMECPRLRKKNGFNAAKGTETRVRVEDGAQKEGGEFGQLNIVVSSINVRCARDIGSGIKGVRPPVLAPPPVMLRSAVDDVSSTWDIFRAFGPQNDEDLGSPRRVGLISSLQEEEEEEEETEEVDGSIGPQNDEDLGSPQSVGLISSLEEEEQEEETEEVDGSIVGKQEPNRLLSESCSDSSNDDNDDDSFSMTMEPVHYFSPNGKFTRGFKSWLKGEFLGSGSFGTVYECITDDGFFLAVKEVSLLDQGSQGKQRISQLEQEISLLSQFEHENIVKYHGTDKDDSKLYIFLELVNKGSLASLYQKYHLRDSQVSAYTRQILNGLNYLHGRKVVHRDIKCANILVDVSGSVKLADFGLAKATTLNDVKSCKGTAFWMAPEVVNRKNHGYGLAADIWSLGCTVLEMLTHQIPYSHLEGMQALFRIGKGERPPIPDTLSRDAQDFILKCLQVKPDDRPTAAQLLEHPFVKKPL